MKIRNHSLVLFAVLLLGTAVFLGSCASTGMQRSARTSASIQVVGTDIRQMIVQVDKTAMALDALVRAGQSDLKSLFDTYAINIGLLEAQGKVVLKHTAEMKARSTEYFSEWEKQGNTYTNPQIRALSEERRSKLAETYAQVPTASEGIQDAYLVYLSDLKEIQKYLSNDLTPNGVEAIAPVAKKTIQDLDVLNASFKPVLAALDQINLELSQ